MRYVYACFKGYIGFYNGLGLDTLEIDFTKCKSNIVLISGMNGCGKSTLMNALSLMPDPLSSFTPNKDGEKILTLFDNGDTYNVRIVSPSDQKGGRKQTKAFISKNGLELNENGNITSYKDIIFSEFELDSNYISLTNLSSSDRGLGDKTPAERKKFVSTIINNLEIYNDIYKTLNKKSLIFKSHLNTLHTKIQNIGNRENLEITLNNLKRQNDEITAQILSINNKIVELQTRVSINNEEAQKIQELKNQESILSDQLSVINNQLMILGKRCKIESDNIEKKHQDNLELRNSYIKIRDDNRIAWKSDSERLSFLNNSINELKANVLSFSNNIDTELENRYKASEKNINELNNRIISSGLSSVDVLKLSSLIDFYSRFVRKIDAFYENLNLEELNFICLNYNPNKVQELNNEFSETCLQIQANSTRINEIHDQMKKLAVLENRPDKCNISSCPFISEALEVKSQLGNVDLVDELSKIQNENLELSEKCSEIQFNIEIYTLCASKHTDLDAIIADIIEINPLLVAVNDDNLSNIDKFKSLVANNYLFNFQREPRRIIDGLNDMKILDSELNTFNVLKAQYESMKNNIELMNKNKESINKMEDELVLVTDRVSKEKTTVDNYSSLVDSLDIIINSESEYISLLNKSKEIHLELDPVLEKIKDIESKSSASIKGALQINSLKSEIDNLTMQSNPIVSDIQKLSGQLTMLDSYYQEYELYKAKYDMIETLKKYCSPTGGGIQTIFMQLYMSKTLEVANQVLGMLFGGEYQLLDFIINQNEFRIPFIGSGLAVDDISSGSTSQICIMGMAINLALFKQASSKFNIARLDEIDSGLDNRNKYEFVNALFRTLPILNIEQLFIISHSIEADTSSVDIIKLKSYNNFEENVQLGNVIYDYNSNT